MSRKICCAIVLMLLCLTPNSYAQGSLEWILRTNAGIGTDYQTLAYDNPNSSGNLYYSAGGGFGVEGGIGYLPIEALETYATVALQKNLAAQVVSSNYGSYKSTFSFGRTTLNVGSNYIYRFPKKHDIGIKLGGGANFNSPGEMRLTEENTDFGKATFHPSIGFHLEAGFVFVWGNWTLMPTLRYRNIHFELDQHAVKSIPTSNRDSYNAYLDYIQNLDVSGVDLSLTLRRRMDNRETNP